MRIAIVVEALQYDDSYYWEKVDSMKDAIESMVKDGYEIRLFSLSQKGNYSQAHNGVTYQFCLNQARMMADIAVWSPEGFILKNFWAPINLLISAKWPNVPKLTIFCGGKLEPPAFKSNWLMVASNAMKAELERQGYKGEIIPDAFTVDEDLFKPDPSVKKVYDLIYVADWRVNKRQELLIDALARPVLQHVKCLFLGAQKGIYNKDYFAKMQQKIAAHGMQNRCILIDRITGKSTVQYYQQSRICIHLGLPTEGGARSVLEGMSCGLPVIVTDDCLSNMTRIDHMINGLGCEPQPAHMAHIINWMLGHPDKMAEFGRAGRQKICALWYGKRMEEHFRACFPKDGEASIVNPKREKLLQVLALTYDLLREEQ